MAVARRTIEAEEPAIVEQTSIAGRNNNPDEVTLRFTKFMPWNNTAYQKGQFAGFKQPEAQRLIASGAAILAEMPGLSRNVADRTMVTK